MHYIKQTLKVLGLAALIMVAQLLSQPSASEAQVTGSQPLSGFAWSSTIGWISFSSAGTGSAVTYGVTKDPATGELSGYAWANPKDDAGLGTIALDAQGLFSSIAQVFMPEKARAQVSVQQWVAYTYPGYGDYYIYLAKLPATRYDYSLANRTVYIYDPVKIYKGGLAAFQANPQAAIAAATDVPVGYTRTPDTRYLYNDAQMRTKSPTQIRNDVDGLASYIPNEYACTTNVANAPQCHVNNLGVWMFGVGYTVGGPIYNSFSDSSSGTAMGQAEIIGTYSVTTDTGGGLQAPTSPTPTPISTPLSPVSTNNVGWITFNKAELVGCPSGVCEAKLSLATGALTGWARACTVFVSGCSGALKPDSQLGGWDGWISLSGTAGDGSSYGPVANAAKNGLLEGFAWGSNVIGWVKFNPFDVTGTPPGDTGGGGTNGGGGGCSGVCDGSVTVPTLSTDITANGQRGSIIEASTRNTAALLAVQSASLSFELGTPITIAWSSYGPATRTCLTKQLSSGPALNSLSLSGSQSVGTPSVGGPYTYQIACVDGATGDTSTSVVAFMVVPKSIVAGSCTLPNGIVLASGETRAFYKNSTRATKALCEELGVNKLQYTCTAGVLSGDPFDPTFTKASCRAGVIQEQ